MRSMLTLCLLLLAAPAWAAERDEGAEAVAQEANRVRDELCSAGADEDTTLAAKSLAEVTTVWAQVSEELDRSRKVYLLYWRGVLGQCLSQEERAIDDLSAFVRSQEGRSLWESLVKDAQLRLQRLVAGIPAKPEPKPASAGGVVGAILAAGAGASGGLAAWQWSEAIVTADVLYGEPHTGTTLTDLGILGDQQQLVSRVLVGSAATLGGAALASFIIGGATAGRSNGRAALSPALAVVPTPGGATFVFGGRW